MPFDGYPFGGRRLLGVIGGDNCRHGYGLALQRATGQTACAYCGLDLVETYEHWLMLSVDHVVPSAEASRLGIPREWLEDAVNKVVCCSACNGLGNRYRLPADTECPASLEAFCALRDRVFAARKALILERHQAERRFFDAKPWRKPAG